MNFTNLEYFLIVAKELNISQAARKIHISQQALSQQIQNLEEELETPLFIRTPKMQLTSAGIYLSNAAARILEMKETACNDLRMIGGVKATKLRLGISYARAEALLPHILPKFYAEYPHITIELLEGGADETQPALERGALDLILVVKPDYPNFISIDLISEELYVVMTYSLLHKYYGASTDSMIEHLRNGFDFSCLRNIPLIMLRNPSMIRTYFEDFLKSKEVTPRIALETKSIQTALALSKTGIGATLYPDLFFSNNLIVNIPANMLAFPVGPYQPLSACYNPKYPLSEAAGTFLNYLQRYLRSIQLSQEGSEDFF